MTLNDYANARDNVVLFWAGIGCPTGTYVPLGNSDWTYAEDCGWLHLDGEVDADGDWRWSGEGSPTDSRQNSVLKMHAYVDARKWAALDAE